MRQVDDAHDPEDQREALRHQGVEAAENDPVEKNLDQDVHENAPFFSGRSTA